VPGNFTSKNAKVLGANVLRSSGGVQLIVFFAAIREILKREIYRADKQSFRCNENKEQMGIRVERRPANHEFGSFGLWMLVFEAVPTALCVVNFNNVGSNIQQLS
jgi:hypothetical protein